ncbi:type II secretion system F family protein [bacterium]|nr:type II secretion system F family protein [bacterium]
MEYIDGQFKKADNTKIQVDKLRADGERTKVKPQMSSFKFYVKAPKREVRPKLGSTRKKSPKRGLSKKVVKSEEKEEITALPKKKRKLNLSLKMVTLTEKMMFMDNLSTMLRAGLALTPALKTINKEIKNKYFKDVLGQLEHHVENGQPLSKGMKQYPKVFSEMIIATVEVGENTGMLADTFGHLADILKAQKALRSKVLGALMYPSIVILALIGVSLFLALAVFPQLVGLFESNDVKLPFILLAVQTINLFIRTQGWFALGGLAALIVLLRIIFSRSKPKLVLHTFMLKWPFIGNLISELALTRFAGNLNALLAAGLAIVKSMDIVSQTIGNLRYRVEIKAMAKELEKGTSLEKTMSKRPDLFPSLTVQLCQVGETTGELENILAKISKYYEDRVNNILTNLSTIIEPVLLVVVGVAVGFIAVSVIGPMYELTMSFAE